MSLSAHLLNEIFQPDDIHPRSSVVSDVLIVVVHDDGERAGGVKTPHVLGHSAEVGGRLRLVAAGLVGQAPHHHRGVVPVTSAQTQN